MPDLRSLQDRGDGTGPPSAREAIAQQKRLAGKVDTEDRLPDPPTSIAGVDAAFPHRGTRCRAAAVLMSWPALEVIETATFETPTVFPYIPGLLSFRELPAVLGALERLSSKPDLVLCDGQGIAHPRRFGIACHLGVETGLATVGVGKSRLCGTHAEPGMEKGDFAPLEENGQTIGRVVRTRSRVRPVFVSAGHRIGLATASDLVVRAATRYRLPEPVHRADRLTRTG